MLLPYPKVHCLIAICSVIKQLRTGIETHHLLKSNFLLICTSKRIGLKQ